VGKGVLAWHEHGRSTSTLTIAREKMAAGTDEKSAKSEWIRFLMFTTRVG
jgi:hypothetical protein